MLHPVVHTLLQMLGSAAVLAGVMVLAGLGWALVAAGGVLCAVSVLAEFRAAQAPPEPSGPAAAGASVTGA